MKRWPGDWRPRAYHHQLNQGPRGHPGNTAMTKTQYLQALKKLDLTPAGKATAEALGLSLRQCQRLASGDSPVPETVAKLLRMMVRHGRPE